MLTAGGHLEFRETVEECAKRELLEETGLHALSIRHSPWVNNVFEDKHYVTLFVFADKFTGDPQLLEPHKCESWHRFKSSALPSPLFPTVASMINKVGIEKVFK
ncbi:MAG: NUDIX hydrolase [Chlamydiales bacterium]